MGHRNEFDFIVIGAGMAGASAAAELAQRGRVAILEAESHAGYHSTGRSAALFSAIYGNAVIRALTRASHEFLFNPPTGFAESPLVTPRQTMYFGRPEQMPTLMKFRADPDIEASTRALSASEAHALVPIFRPSYLGGAVLEPGSADIDVDLLHQGFLRQARSRQAELHLSAPVSALTHRSGRWQALAGQELFSAPVVVNAAGAWGDEIARLARAKPVGLQPLRRTAMLINLPEGSTGQWPAALDIDEQFYFKPDAGQLLLSLADEHPSQPCDAQPLDLVVAIAVDRFEQATGMEVRRIKHRWAGLRVFSPDRSPVVGFDPDVEGFFWLVGQGGYGIQTAAALGRVSSALAAGEHMPRDIAATGVTPALLSKARFGPSPSA
jgi:D-arginine dehydrogenase